jgi:pimeloyl-ACP methyl ester carboxylesterase
MSVQSQSPSASLQVGLPGDVPASASRNGSLHVERTGPEAGVAVVLLHSSGLSSRQWRKLGVSLAAGGYRVVAVDLTGHGQAPAWPEPTPFSYRQDVDALVALLKSGPPAHVVGHSYGALIGLLAALEARSSVRSLALFEPVAFGVLEGADDAEARSELSRVDLPWGTTPDDHDAWLRAFVDYWGGTGAWAALREEARGEFRRVGWVVREGVTTLIGDATPRAAYASLACPATFFSGERSPLAARRVVQHLGATMPNAQVVTIDGAGHMAPLSHGDIVNSAISKGIAAA